MRKAISADERLAVTLRYLATGESFHSLGLSYRIGDRTISSIVSETCQAIYENLKDKYLKVPRTPDEWKKAKMDDKSIGFPISEELGDSCLKCHYHIIGDDAFPLRNDIMKPFPFRQLVHEQQIFNYRLSRARRVVENAFGIMANRFRVLLTKIALEPKKAEKVVLAICCLHNMLIEEQSSYGNALDTEIENHEVNKGSWHFDVPLTELQKTKNRNFSLGAKGQRKLLKQYFCSKSGLLPWQDDMVATKNKQRN
eukprot:gene1940-2206_t